VAGSAVVARAGSVHAFHNVSGCPAYMILRVEPAGEGPWEDLAKNGLLPDNSFVQIRRAGGMGNLSPDAHRQPLQAGVPASFASVGVGRDRVSDHPYRSTLRSPCLLPSAGVGGDGRADGVGPTEVTGMDSRTASQWARKRTWKRLEAGIKCARRICCTSRSPLPPSSVLASHLTQLVQVRPRVWAFPG
jgi:hypothetical protein